jgi:hypothetical protein
MSADERKEIEHTKTGVLLFGTALAVLVICYGICVTILRGGNPSEMLDHPTEMTVFAVIRMWFVSGIPVTFASYMLGVMISALYSSFLDLEVSSSRDRNKAFQNYFHSFVWPLLFLPPLFIICLWYAVSIGVYAD